MKRSITQTVVDSYAAFFMRYPWLIALFAVTMTATALVGLNKLQFNDNLVSLFASRSEAGGDFGDQVEGSDDTCLVMLESENLFSPDGLQVIRDIVKQLEDIDGIERVTSLYDVRKIRKLRRRRVLIRVVPPPDAEPDRIAAAKEAVLEHPMGGGNLVSKDGRSTLMVVELGKDIHETADMARVVEEIQSVVSHCVQDKDIHASITGIPAVRVQMTQSIIRDQLVFNIAGPLVACIVAFCLFRRVAAVVIVTIGPMMGVMWTLGLLGLCGEALNPVNGLVAPLALTIGLADSVHMMFHIRSERSASASPMQAAGSAIRQVGFPCALTSLTSAIGFGSLGIAGLAVIQRFGIFSAVAVIVSFVAVLTIVPLLGSSVLGKYIGDKQPVRADERMKWHTRVVELAVKHRTAAFIVSLVATVAALWLSTQLRADIRFSNGLPSSGNLLPAFQRIDETFGGSIPLVLSVRWSEDIRPTPDELLAAVEAAQHSLENKEIAATPISLATLYEILPEKDRDATFLIQQILEVREGQEQMKRFIDFETRRALVMSRCQDAGSLPIDNLISEVQQELMELESLHPGFSFHVAHSTVAAMRTGNLVVRDLMNSLFMAVPITLVVLMLALRSLRAGLIALLPNIFPMAALAATLVLFDQSIVLTGAAVFCMCFGIAVDDTIHSLAAFQRQFKTGLPADEAIVAAYREIGDAIICTSVILIAGLGVVLLGNTYTTRMFGAMFCLGMAWSLVGDLFILPAVLACFPPRHGKAEE